MEEGFVKEDQFCTPPIRYLILLIIAFQIKVEDASLKCNDIEECSFFCQTTEKDYNVSGTRRIGRMIERVLSKGGDGIPRSSVNWLCSGHNWGRIFVKNGWITGVKGDSIRKMNPLFQFSTNTEAECEEGNLLDSAKNLSVNSSCELCKNMKTCTFFTLSFVVDDKMMSFTTITNFCKGSPIHLKANSGNLLAILQEIDKEASKKGERISKETAAPAYYYGGPITSDHYYDDLKRGSVVPATRL
ncbi:hypothetical protein MACJ_002092 [Theileria orientalis]|uniref:Uncharacterized protein n=1 Tax=Theileria orientalis TaxID=68886 RepID=A0A976QQC0_THEOR|nr:hypothetical protein MACJ_002092 [Theileria orientalis]